MSPPPEADAAGEEEEEQQEDEAQGSMPNFADLLGPDCVIRRVDKDKNVIGGAQPEEMQHELMTRASAQKRLGACAEHVKDMSWQRKLDWALDLKDRANEFYTSSNFEEAAKLYNDCLVALNLDGTAEQNKEVKTRLQLPVCTNLGACMIEMGLYVRCVEICNIALSVDPACPKALYRRGLSHYRQGNHVAARPDFEAALAGISARRENVAASSAGHAESPAPAGAARSEKVDLDNVEKRVLVYLGHIRRFSKQERSSCKRMFEQESLYADRPGAKEEEDHFPEPIDDSDEALDAAVERIRGGWGFCCPCRRGLREKTN